MIARAESEYSLIDRASPRLRDIGREAKKTKLGLLQVERQLDKIGTPQQLRRLDMLERKLGSVGDRATIMGRRIQRSTDTTERHVERMVTRTVASLDRLDVKMGEVGRTTARPHVELTGVAQATAELAALRAELRALGAVTSRPGVNPSVRGVPGVRGGGGGGGRSGAFVGTGGAGLFSTRTGLIAGAAVAALPAIQALTGAATGLVGSLTGATAGLASTTLAGGAALGAGVSFLAAVAIPAAKGLKEAKDAQDKYNEAVADYGRYSRQAIEARNDMNRAFAQAPRGARDLLSQVRQIGSEWRALTRDSQGDFLGLGSDVLRRVRSRAPQFADQARPVTLAARAQGGNFANFLTDRESMATTGFLARAFADNLDEVEQSAENVIRVVQRLARVATPFFEDGVDSLEEWTGGLEKASRNTVGLSHDVEGFVDDLRDWKDLASSALELTWDLLGASRPSGSSLVVSLTRTLDRWDRWVDNNPGRISEFFADAADDTRSMARAVVDIVDGLHDLAEQLRPLIPLFERVASLASALGTLPVGFSAAALGGLGALRGYSRGGRGGRGGGGAAGAGVAAGGGGGFAPFFLGAGGTSAGAALMARGSAQYQAVRALGGSRLAGVGAGGLRYGAGASLRAGGAALRFALPAIAIGGLTGAFGQPGANELSGRGPFLSTAGTVHNAVQGIGATFGIANPVLGTDERVNRGQARAVQFLSGLPGGNSPTGQQAGAQRVAIRGEMNRVNRQLAGTGLSRNDVAELEATIKALHNQYVELGKIQETARQMRREQKRERSVDRGYAFVRDSGHAFDIRSKAEGPEAAMSALTQGTLQKLRTMEGPGRRIIANNTLQWAREQAKANPALLDEVGRLQDGVVKAFSRTGRTAQVVNGRILTGTKREWKAIADQMITQSERAREETQANFTAIQRQAAGQLRAMGFSGREATQLVQGLEPGGGAAGQARRAGAKRAISGGPSYNPYGGLPGGSGDGYGWPRGDGTGNATMRGSVNLMGANPNLGGYASIGAGMGLSVTSGSRPGAVTVSGNTSYHASGNAIDMSGPPDAMMRFARYMASHYGSQLEELIYTPMGAGVKNGQPYTYTGAVAAQHYNHVHVADTDPSARGRGGLSLAGMGGMGSGGMGNVTLNAPNSKLGGLAGAFVNAAGGMYATGLQRRLNRMLGSGGGGFGGGVLSFNQVARLAESVGLPGITFAQIAKGESGFNPRAVGHDPGGTMGLGLWQITTGYNDDIIQRFGGRNAMFNPRTNALAARAIYDRQGIGAWYGTRYMTAPNLHLGQGDGLGFGGWFGSGGDGVARRPTLIGVGDHPRGETFSVRRRPLGPHRGGSNAGGGVARALSVTIQHMEIVNQRRGDIRKVVTEELREAILELADELREDDEEVLV